MIDCDFFDKLEHIARIVRKNDQIFGGIQIILTGDFFQLPPVEKNGSGDCRMIFSTETWNSLIADNIYELKTIYRQNEPEFLALLGDLRSGNLSVHSLELLQGRINMTRDVLLPTDVVLLFSKKESVDKLNNEKLAMLKGEEHVYIAKDDGEPYILESYKVINSY